MSGERSGAELAGQVAVRPSGYTPLTPPTVPATVTGSPPVCGDRLTEAARAQMEVLIEEGCRVVSRRRFARAMRLFDGESLLRVVAPDVPAGAAGGGRGVAPDRAWQVAAGIDQPELPFG